MENDRFETVSEGHGRVEKRVCWAISDASVVEGADDRGEWANLTSAAMIESAHWADGEIAVHRRYS